MWVAVFVHKSEYIICERLFANVLFCQTFDKNVFGLLQSLKAREEGGSSKTKRDKHDKSVPDNTPAVCVVIKFVANRS